MTRDEAKAWQRNQAMIEVFVGERMPEEINAALQAAGYRPRLLWTKDGDALVHHTVPIAKTVAPVLCAQWEESFAALRTTQDQNTEKGTER